MARPARILVVDDEPRVAELVARVLAAAGHVVDTAANGRVALARIHERDGYDLILCDFRMPELDGLALYRELATREPALLGRIVFMTGWVQDADIAEFVARTGAPCLAKPFTLDELRGVVGRILTGS